MRAPGAGVLQLIDEDAVGAVRASASWGCLTFHPDGGLHCAEEVADGLVDSVGRQRQGRIAHTGAQGAGDVERSEYVGAGCSSGRSADCNATVATSSFFITSPNCPLSRSPSIWVSPSRRKK